MCRIWYRKRVPQQADSSLRLAQSGLSNCVFSRNLDLSTIWTVAPQTLIVNYVSLKQLSRWTYITGTFVRVVSLIKTSIYRLTRVACGGELISRVGIANISGSSLSGTSAPNCFVRVVLFNTHVHTASLFLTWVAKTVNTLPSTWVAAEEDVYWSLPFRRAKLAAYTSEISAPVFRVSFPSISRELKLKI
jgi:hypothetical protein